MPRIYSVDLRKKVLSAIDNGSKAVALSKLFQINLKTIYNGQNKLKKLKSLEPIKIGPRIFNRKIKDLDTFKKFVQKKPDRSSSFQSRKTLPRLFVILNILTSAHMA